MDIRVTLASLHWQVIDSNKIERFMFKNIVRTVVCGSRERRSGMSVEITGFKCGFRRANGRRHHASDVHMDWGMQKSAFSFATVMLMWACWLCRGTGNNFEIHLLCVVSALTWIAGAT